MQQDTVPDSSQPYPMFEAEMSVFKENSVGQGHEWFKIRNWKSAAQATLCLSLLTMLKGFTFPILILKKTNDDVLQTYNLIVVYIHFTFSTIMFQKRF